MDDHGESDFALKKRNLNIGAGRLFHPYWTNIDYDSEWYQRFNMKIGISHDLFSRQQLPIEDGKLNLDLSSLTIVYR